LSSFTSLGVPEVLVRTLINQGITDPFPIQTATLPGTLDGRDVLGRGRTGSGKTLAFALPMAALLGGRRGAPRRPRGLILAPTRELANQIAAVLEPLADAVGLRITTIFGGVSQYRQDQALAAGVDIVVACPGRLEDLLKQRLLTLEAVEITVLDEADHMADLGFLPGVRRIMSATPARGQRMLFSATLDNGVDQIVKQFLHDPMRQSVDPEQSQIAEMTHHVFTVDGADTKRAVVEYLASGVGRRLLFTRTKHQAKKLAKQLTAAGIPAVDLHGNLSQPARERNLELFSHGSVRVLVATDIAARGIHVDDIELVVHVDPPAEHKAYLHRSGRTARAGSGGDVVTLVLPEQAGDFRALTRLAKITATPQAVRAGSPALLKLVGEVAAHVTPTAMALDAAGGGRPSSGGGRRGGRSGSGAPRGAGSASGASRGSASGASRGAPSGASRGAASAGGGRGRGGAKAPASAGGVRYSTSSSAPHASASTASTATRNAVAAPAGGRRTGGVELSMRSSSGRRRGR
jgi:superfamily II DNA/RNA helicase